MNPSPFTFYMYKKSDSYVSLKQLKYIKQQQRARVDQKSGQFNQPEPTACCCFFLMRFKRREIMLRGKTTEHIQKRKKWGCTTLILKKVRIVPIVQDTKRAKLCGLAYRYVGTGEPCGSPHNPPKVKASHALDIKIPPVIKRRAVVRLRNSGC